MKKLLGVMCVILAAACVWAQQDTTPVEPMDQTPIFRVNVVSRTTRAVNYRHRGGSTTVDLKGTTLMSQAGGKAKVDSKEGRLEIHAEFTHLQPATKFGTQYLTYVLWAITPEGRPVNLGEVLLDQEGRAELHVTSDLQAFGLIVTAEPYFAVTRPSNLVVEENIIRQQTKGWEEAIDAKFDMLEGGQYTIDVNPQQLPSATASPKTPLDLLEARNAVAIAKAAGAAQYAADSLAKAEDFLARAEDYLRRKQGRTPIGTVSRGATEMAEDARVLTLQKKQAEKVAAEKRAMQEREEKARAEAQAAAEREAQATAQAEEDARRRQQAEADRAAAEKAKAEAERMKAEAEAARAAALAEQQKAQAEAEKARLAAEQAERQKEEAIRQKEEMRARLLNQLNQVLETKDTMRGLVVSMPDVLFDTGQYTLKPAARERLARVAGIVVAYPELKFEIEGHTDSIGSDEFNQSLSEKRAATVRDYLVDSGVSINNVIARGFGKTRPIADNTSAPGRKLNRRVEMIVSGDVIGTKIGSDTDLDGSKVIPPQPTPVSVPLPHN
ncbi:MAG TPA: OmpA family protein [Terriglobales bacterium]|jgi:outer membrane protein OmpA-like peptidoglycan-associated protein|nr:OmpA family protein [Terriglobales bacterium]